MTFTGEVFEELSREELVRRCYELERDVTWAEDSLLNTPAEQRVRRLERKVEYLEEALEHCALKVAAWLHGLLSAVAHAMWIEQFNRRAAIYTGGKMHEKSAETVSRKMNIKLNAPVLGRVDLRIPAAQYTVEHGRRGLSKKTETRYDMKDLCGAAHDKYESKQHNRRKKDNIEQAQKFFGDLCN